MLKDRMPVVLEGIIEADESFVGGKNKNRHWDKKVKGSQGRSRKDKTPVVGLVARGGKVVTFVTADTDKETLHQIIDNNVANGATIVTDAYHSYRGLDENYKHVIVKHTAGNFFVHRENGVDYHTQHIEGYWSSIKRGYVGVYHYMSPKHLQRYCDEYAFRYNTRTITDQERFEQAILLGIGTHLRYDTLIGKS